MTKVTWARTVRGPAARTELAQFGSESDKFGVAPVGSRAGVLVVGTVDRVVWRPPVITLHTVSVAATTDNVLHSIPVHAWQHISYPTAVPDSETGELISDAEVAEIPHYTAFASRKKSERVTARLIVRRVRDLAKPAVVGEQGELFPAWRYHPFFTDQPAAPLQAERERRHHAVIEQVIADSKNSAWLTCGP